MAFNTNWSSLFKQLAIGVAINIGIQALTGGKDDASDPGQPKPPESDPEKPLPLFWGTCRLGLNVFRYGKSDRRPVSEKKSFLGITYGSRVVGYEYYLTAAAWLSHGQLAGVVDWIINGTKVVSRGGAQTYQVEGVPIGGLTQDGQVYTTRWYDTATGPSMTPAQLFDPAIKWPDGALNFISVRNILGDAGGVSGAVRLYPGDGSHASNPVLNAINAVQDPDYTEPAYREWAYLVFEDTYVGNSPELPSIECIGSRATPILGSGSRLMPYEQRVFAALPSPYAPNPGLVEGDANPAGILWEMMVNHKTGLGIPYAFMHEPDWNSNWEILRAENFGLSHRIETIQAGENDVNDVLRHIDGVIYFDLSMGKYRFRLLRPYTGDVSSLPLLDKRMLTSVEYAESAISQNVNQVNVEFTNVYRDCLKDIVKVQNLAAIQQAQRFNVQTVQYPSITRPALALQVGQRDLRVQSSILGRGSFVGNRALIQYTPGELVRILWPEKGLFGKVVRIGEIDYGSLEDGKISGTFIEDYWSMESASYEAELPAAPGVPDTPFVVPTVTVDVAIDTLVSVVYNLLIIDPLNRVTAVEYSEQVGDGAQTPWVADTDTVYDYEMLKNPVYSTRAFYRVSYTDIDGITQYIVGEFPQPTVATTGLAKPTLSYLYSGTDVIVTATVGAGATGVRFDDATNAQPSDADVLAGSLDSTAPYAVTYPAPTGTDVLYVGALATDGTLNSGVARIQIPPKPVSTWAAAPVMDVASAQFPAGRVLVDGVGTTVNRDTAGFIAIDTEYVPPDPGVGGVSVYQTVVKTAGALADGASQTIILDIAKTVAFQRVVVTAATWVRVYTTLAKLIADSGRSFGTDPTFANRPVFETAGGVGGFSLTTELHEDNPVANNGDEPRIGRFYMRVTNMSGASATPTISIRYLPLEGMLTAPPPSGVITGMLWEFDVRALTPVADGTETLSVPNTGLLGGNIVSGSAFGSGPKYKVNQFGSQPGIKFSQIGGNTRHYDLPTAGFVEPTESHIFCVLKTIGGGAAWRLGPDRTAFPNAAGNVSDYHQSSAERLVPIPNPTVPFLYYSHSAAGLWKADVGLTEVFITATNTVQATGMKTLGGHLAGGFLADIFEGVMGYWRFVSGALTDDEVLGIKFDIADDYELTL